MIYMPVIIMVMPQGEEHDFIDGLYKEHSRLMFATAWKYCNSKHGVEEIVSDSCIAFIKNMDTLRNLEDTSLKAYIVTTIKNTAINYTNKQRRIHSNESEIPDVMNDAVSHDMDVAQKIVLKDELRLVLAAIESLPKKEMLIMRMKYLMEMSDSEIAEQLGLSGNFIRKYISRARQRIREAVYSEA